MRINVLVYQKIPNLSNCIFIEKFKHTLPKKKYYILQLTILQHVFFTGYSHAYGRAWTAGCAEVSLFRTYAAVGSSTTITSDRQREGESEGES